MIILKLFPQKEVDCWGVSINIPRQLESSQLDSVTVRYGDIQLETGVEGELETEWSKSMNFRIVEYLRYIYDILCI